MADYVPIIQDADSYTLAASATIPGGSLVAISGPGTVAAAGANAVNWVGVNAFDCVSGQAVTLFRNGIQHLVASGTVTAGDLVAAAAGGQVATSATPTTGQLVGVALTTATTGNQVRVLFVR
jgi:hypothetical protein